MNYKYRHYNNQNEWQEAVNSFLKKRYIRSEPIKDLEDMVISYDGRGMTLAVWDLVDNEGWLITDDYYNRKGIVEQLIGAFCSG